jgi:hypothetical protein
LRQQSLRCDTGSADEGEDAERLLDAVELERNPVPSRVVLPRFSHACFR